MFTMQNDIPTSC